MSIANQISNDEITPQYSFRKVGDVYQILDRGELMHAQNRKPLETPYLELAEEVVSDLNRSGDFPGSEINMYACLMTLLDFGEIHGSPGFVAKILCDLGFDPLLRPPAFPPMMIITQMAMNQPYFEDIQLRQKIKDNTLFSWAARELATWSLEELVAVIYVTTHSNCPLLGMAVAQDRANLELMAPLLCGILREHRQSRSFFNFTINIGECDVEGFNSGRENLKFCQSECLSDDQKPNKPMSPEELEARIENFRRNCGVVIGLDVLRRFAAFGRKRRLGR